MKSCEYNPIQETTPQAHIKVITRLRGPISKSTSFPKPSLSPSKSPSSRKASSKSPISKNRPKNTSKSPSQQSTSPTSTAPSVQIGLNETTKYTIFTNKHPSNTIVITSKPITGKTINDTFKKTNDLYEFSKTILKDSSLIEYDKVYNESVRLDTIYNDTIKENISNLFHGKNACVLLFGPMDGGKSYLLRGAADQKSNEPGLLSRAVNDLFNLVDLTKQANHVGSKVSYYFVVKCSAYQVYLDNVNDLLSREPRQIKLEKYVDENSINCNMIGLTQKEIRNKNEYDMCIKEAVNHRKWLTQVFKVNELKRKSHFVIALRIEKREKTCDGITKLSNENSVDSFAQIDFVELASSNYGFMNDIDDGSNMQGVLYGDTSKVFNAVCNNIVSASAGLTPKNETKLTLCLKKTLRQGSDVTLFNCVVPWEYPLNQSLKAIKFTNWLRNQVMNINENVDYPIKTSYYDDGLQMGNSHEMGDSIGNAGSSLLKKSFQEDYANVSVPGMGGDGMMYQQQQQPLQQQYEQQGMNNYCDNNNNNNARYNAGYMNIVNHNNNSNNVSGYPQQCNISTISDNKQGLSPNNRSGQIPNLQRNYLGNYSEPNNMRNVHLRGQPNKYPSNISTTNPNNASVNKSQINSSAMNFENHYSSNDESDIRMFRDRAKKKYQSFDFANNDSKTAPHNNTSLVMNHSSQNLLHNKHPPFISPSISPPETNRPMDIPRNQSITYDQYGYQQAMSPQEQQIHYLENTLHNLEEKSMELSRKLDNLHNVDDSRMAVKSSTLNNNNISVSYLPDAEIDKIKQDYATLKSDNIIFREDINRLTDLNKHLEDELTQQRSRNLELAAENEKITQEKLYLENKVKTLGEDLERNKIKEQNMVETFNQRVIIENRAKDAECSVNKMREEKAKFEIEYRVLKEKYDELKKNYDCLENSFATTKSSHDEEINKIEEKIEVMAHEMEKLQKENSTLRGSDEKRRQEIISLEQQRDGYREKYQEQKNKNNLLNSKLAEIEEDFRNIMKERENEQSLKLKEEELKRMKLDSKAKIVSELQNRIQNYKNERLKKKSEDV